MSSAIALKNSKLLCQLDSSRREMLLSQSITCTYNKGQQIVRAGDDDHIVYFIDSGSVRVTLYSKSGKEVSFAELEAGANFGELSAIDGALRTANVIALTTATVTSMPSSVFKQIIHDNPEVCDKLLLQLSTMIRRLSDRVFEFSTLGAKNRIHAELLRMAREHTDLDGIARIPDPPTHSQLASRVSSHREAVSRELSELEKERIITREKNRLIVHDIARLVQLVEEVQTHD